MMTITLDPQGWGIASEQDILRIIRSVHEVFAPCFGASINENNLLVVHSSDHPSTYKSNRVILLSATDLHWCQYAYQFTHEYCHYQIQGNVPQHLRWFEESLCELASYYFLPLITELWKKSPPYPSWISYADHFSLYVQNDQKKAEAFDLNFASNPTTLTYLTLHEYDRGKNSHVANTLMPIFFQTPTLWSVVPLIGGIPNHLSFADSLRFWQDLSPDCYKSSIQNISEVFHLNS